MITWRRIRIGARRWLRRVLQQEGRPEAIAAGVAIGVFVSMTPTIGLQMIIGVAIATVVRANKIGAAAMAWITNPVTIPPIYYFNYWVGSLILGGATGPKTRARFDALGEAASAFNFTEFGASVSAVWQELVGLGTEILWPLLLGCLIVGTVLGATAYPLTLRAVFAFRRRREQRARRRHERMLAAAGGSAVGRVEMAPSPFDSGGSLPIPAGREAAPAPQTTPVPPGDPSPAPVNPGSERQGPSGPETDPDTPKQSESEAVT